MFRSPQATSDDLSELEPRLPIPNRTVKRLSADDSADYPCESRTSSGTYKTRKPVLFEIGLFCFDLLCFWIFLEWCRTGERGALHVPP